MEFIANRLTFLKGVNDSNVWIVSVFYRGIGQKLNIVLFHTVYFSIFSGLQ